MGYSLGILLGQFSRYRRGNGMTIPGGIALRMRQQRCLTYFFAQGIAAVAEIIRKRERVALAGVINLQKTRLLRLLLVVASVEVKTATAQKTPIQEPPSVSESTSTIGGQKKNISELHRFWDRKNGWSFAGVGAARTLDYFSTLNMRRRGRQEIFLTNDVVDNHPAFATIEVATAGTSIGASYLFHRYGHHKLERWTSFVHIGLTTTGAIRNYCLKTAHPKTSP